MAKRRSTSRGRGSSGGSSRRRGHKETLIKRQQEREKRETSGKSFFKDGLDLTFWNPKDGEHTIDIIDFYMGADAPIHDGEPVCPEGEEDYVLDVFVHYGVGVMEDQSVICLAKTYEQPCPICEHAKKLRSEGEVDDEVWQDLRPKRRCIYNIVCYDSNREEEKGIQVWNVAHFYMQKHLRKLQRGPTRARGRDEEELWIPFADPDEGKSINFEIEPPKSRNDFATYVGHRFLERDYKISDEILDQAHQLDQLIHIPTYEEVYELYWDEPVDADETPEEPSEPDDAGEEERVSTDECPYNGEFGKDFGELNECNDDCPDKTWEACEDRHKELEKEKEEEKPARRRRRSSK